MDFTKVNCISEKCKGKNVLMQGAGGSFGGRISFAKLKCPNCETSIIILPLKKEFEYNITATTEEERIEKRIEEARKQSELELAKTITRIKKTGY